MSFYGIPLIIPYETYTTFINENFVIFLNDNTIYGTWLFINFIYLLFIFFIVRFIFWLLIFIKNRL